MSAIIVGLLVLSGFCLRHEYYVGAVVLGIPGVLLFMRELKKGN